MKCTFFQRREIGLDERFFYIISFLLNCGISALFIVLGRMCIELSLSILECSILFDLLRRFSAFLVELRLIGTGKGKGFARFLESCKSFQPCLVLFRVLTNNYNSRLQLSCGGGSPFVFFFWTDLASIIFDGGLHIHTGEGTRSYYFREATFLSLC